MYCVPWHHVYLYFKMLQFHHGMDVMFSWVYHKPSAATAQRTTPEPLRKSNDPRLNSNYTMIQNMLFFWCLIACMKPSHIPASIWFFLYSGESQWHNASSLALPLSSFRLCADLFSCCQNTSHQIKFSLPGQRGLSRRHCGGIGLSPILPMSMPVSHKDLNRSKV